MSAATARRLATAGSLSLALALAGPAAALADHKQGHDKDSSARPTSSPSPTAAASASPKPKAKPQPKPSKSSKAGGTDGGKDGRTSPSPRSGSADRDPRGNNGTVKIDGEPFDSTPGNEPHVGCTFQVDFFGFDAGDTALVTLTGHAPTGGGQLYSKRHTISTDAAGGGQDVDESITFTAAQLGLFSITPHPKQGWHVKLAADVDSAPGGAKQKVFWVKCDAPATGGTTQQGATGGGGTVTTRGAGTTALPPTFGSGSTTTTASGVAGTSQFGSSASAGTTALSGGTSQAATAPGAETVSARSATRPSVLPFTGMEGLAYLLALGASAVGVGVAAHRLGRRRAVTPEA